jgi:helicase
MKRLDAGTVGGAFEQASLMVDHLPRPWSGILPVLTGGNSLRPVQQLAIDEARILQTRQHLVVCAPTNSGKSLVGHLVLLDAVFRGQRAVLLEPLRALAQEQSDTLTELMASLAQQGSARAPKVRLSTGEYRPDGELPTAAPPEEGEIIVATPERFDAILRNPKNAAWVSSIGAVVVDEAQLLRDPRRGPTLELLVASMLSLTPPARVALLSATVGEPERLREWLQPCQLIVSTARTLLRKQVWQLASDEDPDEMIADELRALLCEFSTAGIVFVYRRSAAEALATKLSQVLGVSVLAYHSGQSASERASIRAQFLIGACRCLVATTALGMGVNLPATHVFVRDTTFFGSGRLRVDELLQILGRAGRVNRGGSGAVLVRPSDDWTGEDLAQALRQEAIPPLQSSFETLFTRGRRGAPDATNGASLAAASLVATCLVRAGEDGLDAAGISALLANTLGGGALVSRIDVALRWLFDPSRAIAFRDERGCVQLTVLGNIGVKSMLPLVYLGGVGQLVRDLISLDTHAKLLWRWSSLDHLFLISLLSDRAPKLRRFSEELADQIDGWFESRPTTEKSLLFAEWVMGTAQGSKADELFGSLSIADRRPDRDGSDTARKKAYTAMLPALVLDERSRGVPLSEIERRWGVSGLEGIEETWRDTALWLLSGHASLFEIRAFYHHIREHCSATTEQIRDIKRALGRISGQAYDLLEQLKYCSPLGPMLRGIRASLGAVEGSRLGAGTIRKLEGAGICTMQHVAQMDMPMLLNVGVPKRFAQQILAYTRRRLR